jgi:GNAT superfamily N-acetyltransferase
MVELLKAELSVPEHANAVLAVLDEYAMDIMGGGNCLPDYTKENLVSALSRLPHCHIILAFDETKPVGLAICFEGFSTFACRKVLNIHDFTVVPAARGRGISKVLLSRIEAVAHDLGCCKLTLEVLEGNKLAQQIYKNFGFESYELNPEMGRAMFYEKKLG